MATIKLKKPGTGGALSLRPERLPVRGAGAGAKGARPTLAQAQTQRAESEMRYQEQLRQRFGGRPPEGFVHRGDDSAPPRRPSAAPKTKAPAATASTFTGARAPRSGNAAFTPRHETRPAPRHGAAHDTPRNPPAREPRHAPAQPTRDDLRTPARSGAPFDPRRGAPVDPRRGPRADSRALLPTHPRSPPRGVRHAESPAVRSDTARADRRPRQAERDDDRFEPTAHAPGSLRLSKRMSELGIASRREADEWIALGYVRVDDQIVSELGSRVMPHQRVTIDAKAKFMQAQRVTVLVNKPVGYVSGQAEDGYEPAVVLVTPDRLSREDRSGTRFLRSHLNHLVPAGRLDIDSVGLLVLTQDGRIAKQLIGEDGEVEKEYLVRVASLDPRGLHDSGLALLRHGLELDGEALQPAHVEWVNDDQLRFVLTQGKKRQIRRMCEAVGLQVLGLKRVRIGQVMLGDLPTGQWRYLRADETFV